jgi:hypothetical protein
VLPGELRRVRITQATDYDLVGEVDENQAPLVAGGERQAAAAHFVHRESDGRRVVLRTLKAPVPAPES